MPTLAKQFHKRARDSLLELGLRPANEAGRAMGPHQHSHALYRSATGFYVLVAFDPLETHQAGIYGGRRWSGDFGWYSMSHSLTVFALLRGIRLPASYELIDSKVPHEVILADLHRALPTIWDGLNMQEIDNIERREGGARWRAEGMFGADFMRCVGVTEFFPDRADSATF